MSRRAGVPLGPLALVTAAVLAAHWLALRSAPLPVAAQRLSPDWRLSVRSVVDAPPAQAGPGSPAPAPAADPRPQRSRAEPAAALRGPSRPAAPAALVPPSHSAAQAAPEPTPGAPPPQLPDPALWRYEATASWRGLPAAGQAELAWQHDGSEYEATLAIRVPSMPARLQRSTGRIGPEGLLPQRFSDRTRSEEAAHFDRAGGRIVFSGNRAPAALEPGAQDRLSVLLQVSALLAGDPSRFTEGRRLLLQAAGTRGADRWELVVDGAQELALPGGTVTATKLSRAPRHEYDARMEAWFGPGPAYGPVRLRLTWPHGDWLDLQWSGTDKR